MLVRFQEISSLKENLLLPNEPYKAILGFSQCLVLLLKSVFSVQKN